MNALHQLLAATAKETRLILRDRQALAILFVMPVVFVTILSLALRDAFSEHAGVRFSMLIVDHDQGRVGRELGEIFLQGRHFQAERAAAPLPGADRLGELVQNGQYRFVLVIPAGASRQAQRRAEEQLRIEGPPRAAAAPVTLQLLSDPTLRADHRNLILAFTNGAIRTVEAAILADRLAGLARGAGGAPVLSAKRLAAPRLIDPLGDDREATAGKAPVPTSVQQNAPAWTLLAMFFLAIPLSVTFIKERSQGSLTRLQSMPVPSWILFGGKVLPYFIINQLQLLLILGFGVWGLPLFGGDRLELGDAPLAIAVVGISASLAAIGFALLIATLSRTPEQATTLSATTVLILAALGGIMVPKIVMPETMQQIAVFSPFSWGLEGFLDVFIRGGGVADVLPESALLLSFGGLCLVAALLRYHWQLRRH